MKILIEMIRGMIIHFDGEKEDPLCDDQKGEDDPLWWWKGGGLSTDGEDV